MTERQHGDRVDTRGGPPTLAASGLTVGIGLQWLFRAVIRRHDDVADGNERQP